MSLAIILGVGLLIVSLLALAYFMWPVEAPAVLPPAGVTPPPAVVAPPARPTTLSDCGYQGLPRGWYDIKGVGYKNDFCRNVGDAATPTWSCKIFNGDNETHTYDPNMPFDKYENNLTGWHCP